MYLTEKKNEERNTVPELKLDLMDSEGPFEYTEHDRVIARAVVFDDKGLFYFVRTYRDDDFGKATLIETSGGGVEEGESPEQAVIRELKEELGAKVKIICKIGTVSDRYNLIHRHNINNYYLCKALSFGEKKLTKDEVDDFHLSTLMLSYEEAMEEYEKRKETPIGRLIANREVPVLERAKEILGKGTDALSFVSLRERPELKEEAAEWFHSKWGVPKEAYLSCIDEYISASTELGWYLCLDGVRIVGGLGIIENDFHERKDLTPNICAVYTEETYRGRGIAGKLLDLAVDEMRKRGISPLYLLTDHCGFYERYGWEFFCMVQGDGEEEPSRMYIHR